MKLPEADIKKVSWSSDVYEPSDDSFALVDAVHAWLQQLQESPQQHQQLPQTCLEVGCGSGFVICSVALALQQLYKQSDRITNGSADNRTGVTGNSSSSSSSPSSSISSSFSLLATDISAAALAATAQTLQAHQVSGVELVQSDLASSLLPRLTGAVDLLLFNPPYVPTPDEEVHRDGIARAWAGGHLGRRVTDRLLAQLPQLLSPVGHAFVVTVPENRPQEIISLMAEAGLYASIVLTRAADEESLQILHISRQQPYAAAAAAAATTTAAAAPAVLTASAATPGP